MQIVFSIIASIIIVYIWIWILNTIFSEKKIRTLVSSKIIISGIFLVGILSLYTYIPQRFPQWKEFQVQLSHINTENILIFIGYCILAITILITLFRRRYRQILQTLLIGSILFISVGYGSYLLGINIVIIYYIIAAYAEEYLKYTTANTINYQENIINTSDLIIFCILIALGFSLIENILYIIVNILQHNQIQIINILVGRGVVSALIHMVSTGLIAFISINFKKTHITALALIVGLIVGFGLHTTYNLGLHYQLSYITVSVIILSFFLLSYLFFRSDRLYKQN